MVAHTRTPVRSGPVQGLVSLYHESAPQTGGFVRGRRPLGPGLQGVTPCKKYHPRRGYFEPR